MIDRRDLLRTLALLSLAASTPGLLAACGEDGGGGSEADLEELRLVSADVPRESGSPEAIPDVTSALQRLAGRLYGELATIPGNLALSPYSIGAALAMAVNGAGGRTASEMLGLLGADDLARYNGGLNALTQELESLAGERKRADGESYEIALATANQLFGQHDVAWTKTFLEVLAREYGAGMRTVDFVNAVEEARQLINAWTSERTEDRIPELIPDGVLTDMTRLVLVNALYFKAPWQVPFETDLTAELPFQGAGGSVDVPTMTGNPAALLKEGDGWQAARIPYQGGELAMTLVLPDEGRLADIEAAVVDGSLVEILSGGRHVELDLRLPKWTFRSRSPLVDMLKAVGMTTAFDPNNADFLAMTDEDLQLYISAVLHEAFIAVDEEGTEAAAATAIGFGVTSMPIYEKFHVDRPFLFVIHDVEHGTPLFLGRVMDPLAE